MAKILVVDDEMIIGNLLARMLLLMGHTSTVVTRAAEGLRALGADQPDLVFCDIRMPEMDGFAFVAEARMFFHADKLPIVLMTGFTEQQEKVSQLLDTHEIQELIAKPFDYAQIQATVNRILAR